MSPRPKVVGAKVVGATAKAPSKSAPKPASKSAPTSAPKSAAAPARVAKVPAVSVVRGLGVDAHEDPSRSHAAYVEIKRRILDLRMPPGSDFTESDFVAEFGLSKTPIREALARLRQEGLVTSAARSGYHVSPVTVKDARDLMGLRCVLEGEAAALAASRSIDVDRLRHLEELCHSSYDPRDRGSVVAFLGANFTFHTAIAELSGNARLAEALREVLEQLERIMHLGLVATSRAEEIVHEHHDLLAAISVGDADRAREVAVSQARAAQRMILEALLDSDAVQSTNLMLVAPRS